MVFYILQNGVFTLKIISSSKGKIVTLLASFELHSAKLRNFWNFRVVEILTRLYVIIALRLYFMIAVMI